jgi:Txe/YoeB family toxin of Txe-Axe toxin-antitoxin module
MELQRAAPVDVVATLSPAGVLGPEARTTGIYLARAHALSGDLEDATRRASGNGAAQYRWFPQGGAEVQGMRGDENNELAHRVDDLVRALQGDPFSGAPGLLAQLSALSTDMRAYMAETDRRLRRLEQQRLHPHHLSIVLVALLVAAVLLLGVWGVR